MLFSDVLPMVELLVGTVRQHNTVRPMLVASSPNFFSISWWWSLSRKKIPVAYLPNGGKSIWCVSLERKEKVSYSRCLHSNVTTSRLSIPTYYITNIY